MGDQPCGRHRHAGPPGQAEIGLDTVSDGSVRCENVAMTGGLLIGRAPCLSPQGATSISVRPPTLFAFSHTALGAAANSGPPPIAIPGPTPLLGAGRRHVHPLIHGSNPTPPALPFTNSAKRLTPRRGLRTPPSYFCRPARLAGSYRSHRGALIHVHAQMCVSYKLGRVH